MNAVVMYKLFCFVTSVSRDTAGCIFFESSLRFATPYVELCWQEASTGN